MIECRLGGKKKRKKIIKYLTKHQAAAHTHTHTLNSILSSQKEKRSPLKVQRCGQVLGHNSRFLAEPQEVHLLHPGTDSLNSQQSGSEIKPFYFLMLVPEEQHGAFTTAGSKEKTTKGNTKHRPDNCTRFKGKH